MNRFNLYVPSAIAKIDGIACKSTILKMPIQRKNSENPARLKGKSVMDYSTSSISSFANYKMVNQLSATPRYPIAKPIKSCSNGVSDILDVSKNTINEFKEKEIDSLIHKKETLAEECRQLEEKIQYYKSKEAYLIEKEKKLDEFQKNLENKSAELIIEEESIAQEKRRLLCEDDKMNKERMEMQREKQTFLQTVAEVISQKKQQSIAEQMLGIKAVRNTQSMKSQESKSKQLWEEEQAIKQKQNELNKKEIELLEKETALEAKERKITEEEASIKNKKLELEEIQSEIRQRENNAKKLESQIIEYKENDHKLELKKIGIDMLQEILSKKTELERQSIEEEKTKLNKLGKDLMIKEKRLSLANKTNKENHYIN